MRRRCDSSSIGIEEVSKGGEDGIKLNFAAVTHGAGIAEDADVLCTDGNGNVGEHAWEPT